MGLFSSKKKIFVGVSNSKLIEDNTAPQAIKDSVTAYINDSGKTNGKLDMSLVDYSNIAVEQSIVQGVKKLGRWVKKPGMYNTVGSTVAAMNTLSDNDIQNIVADHIQSKHSAPITFYYLNNLAYDYGHLTKQALIDSKAYEPSTNILIHNGIELYLEDAVIKTQEELNKDELFPLPFTVLATPFREEDIERDYTPANFVVDPTFQFDFYEAIGTNMLTVLNIETITTTTVTTPDNPEPVITEERSPVEVVNNIPELDKVSQEFIESVPTEELISDETTTDEAGVITQIVITKYIVEDRYKCQYSFRGTYSKYVYSGDIDFETPPIEEVIEIIDSIEEVNIAMQVGYEYKGANGKRTIVYDTLTDAEVSDLHTEGSQKPFGDFIPNLYFKCNSVDVDKNKDSELYKQSRKYAKKLNLTYNDLAEELRKAVEDPKPIIHTYLKFAVNYESTNAADLEYLFNFFKKYFNFCDSENIYPTGFKYLVDTDYPLAGKALAFKDKILRYEVTTNKISYFRGTSTTAEKIGVIKTGVGKIEPPPKESGLPGFIKDYIAKINSTYKYFRRFITETEYEEYRIFGMVASNLVKNGKWANSGGDNGHLLIPVDFAVVNSIKGFRSKERFIYNCMYIEFLTYVVQKVKWYQRGVFKLLVFAISVVITVVTGGAGVTVASVLIAAVTNLAIGLAINFIIKQLTKILSPSLLKVVAGLIAIAGLAYGRFAAMGAGSFSKAFTIMFMKANQFLAVSNQLIKATIVKQGLEFQEQAKEQAQKMKTLEDYKKANYKYITDTNLSYLNEQEHRYEPLVIGESLDTMIARTLNTNPGLVTIDYIHGYVDYIITLPTVDETKYVSLDEQEKDNAE